MDLTIDPHATLAELQLTLFMAAITALVELAKTTDKDHIKLRALTEVARLCNPSKPRAPIPHGTPSGSAGPQAFAPSQATEHPPAPAPVARARGSVRSESAAPTRSALTASSPPLNRQQRRMLARLEANDRQRQQHAA